jgi:hypothetical protein
MCLPCDNGFVGNVARDDREHMGKPKKPTTPAEQTTDDLAQLTADIAALNYHTVKELAQRYAELAGEPTRSRNRGYLVKRVAWLLQEKASGGLTAAARMRISDLGDMLPREWRERLTQRAPAFVHDPRVPAVGVRMTKIYQKTKHVVTVLPSGFEYNGKAFKTLSDVAFAITGTKWNGFRFFGLSKKGGAQ